MTGGSVGRRIFLVLSCALLVVVAVGCGEGAESSVRWDEPLLTDPCWLVIRYGGTLTGPVSLRLEPREPGAFPARDLVVDPSAATPRGPGVSWVELPLVPPLVEPAVLVTPDGPRPLDGPAALDGLLRPLERLDDATLRRVLSKAESMRGLLALQPGELVNVRRIMADFLAGEGLDAGKLRRLRRFLASVPPGVVTPASAAGRKLLPLRMIEAVMGGADGLLMGWGEADRAVGLRYAPLSEIPAREGWRRVAGLRVVDEVPFEGDPNLLVERWRWLVTPEMERSLQSGGTMSFAVGAVFKGADDVEPELSACTTVADLDLVADPLAGPGPFRGAALDLILRAHQREAIVEVEVGGLSFALVAGGTLQVHQPDISDLDPFVVSVPFPPEAVLRPPFRVTLRLREMPHRGPTLPLRVKALALRVPTGAAKEGAGD